MFKLILPKKLSVASESKDNKRTTILLLILALGAFMRFVFVPDLNNLKKFSEEKRAKQAELSRKKAAIITTEELLKNPQKYEDEYTQAQQVLSGLVEKIAYLKNILVKKENIAEVLNSLTSAARPEEIKFNLIRMNSIEEGSYFNILPIEMKITADFFAFLNYVKDIESLPILINIKQLDIASPESTGTLNIEAKLNVYVGI